MLPLSLQKYNQKVVKQKSILLNRKIFANEDKRNMGLYVSVRPLEEYHTPRS